MITQELISGVASTKKQSVKIPVDVPIPGDKPSSPILKTAAQSGAPAEAPKPSGAVRTLGLVSSTASPVAGASSESSAPTASPATPAAAKAAAPAPAATADTAAAEKPVTATPAKATVKASA